VSETFTYQVNLKAGNDLLNIRADSAEEFTERIDALFGEGAAVRVLAPFFGFRPENSTGAAPAVVSPAPAAPASTGTSTCPQCGIGQVVTKNRKDGKGTFQGCDQYPKCNFIARGR